MFRSAASLFLYGLALGQQDAHQVGAELIDEFAIGDDALSITVMERVSMVQNTAFVNVKRAKAASKPSSSWTVLLDRGATHAHDAADVVHQDTKKTKEPQEVEISPYALPAAAFLVSAVIIFIYGPRGTSVVLAVLVYLGALSSMKLAVKWVFVTYDFSFPKLVSALHFISGAIVSRLVYVARGKEMPTPTQSEFMLILPIALAVSLSIGATNVALVFSSAAFTEIVGATNCLVTIGMVAVMGMPVDRRLLGPAMLVALGCGISTAGEINFSMLALILCFLANVFRSMKVSFQQKLMTGETKDKFDPCALLFWSSVPSTVMMLAASITTEGMEPYRVMASRDSSALAGLLFAIGMSCVNATILNMAQLFVTKDLGAVGSQLVSQAKMVLTVLGGMVLFGESMSRVEVVGFVLVLCGVYAFSRMEQAIKESKDLEKKQLLPQEKQAREPSYKTTESEVSTTDSETAKSV